MKLAVVILLAVSAASFVFAQIPDERVPITSQEVAIVVTGPSREILLTNQHGDYILTESSADNRSALEGWHVSGRKVIDDYAVEFDNRPLRRSDVVRTIVAPNEYIREYKNGAREIVTLLDHTNALSMILDKASKKEFRIRPYFKDVRDTNDILSALRFGELIIGKAYHQLPTPADTSPGWLGMLITPAASFSFSYLEPDSGRNGFSPSTMAAALPGEQYAVIFVASNVSKTILNLGTTNINTFLDSVYDRRVRIDQMFKKSYLRIDDSSSFKTIQWAKATLDQCLPRNGMPVLLSGYPGDPAEQTGAMLRVIADAYIPAGFLNESKLLLQTIAAAQDTNRSSQTYGRFPRSLSIRPYKFDDAESAPAFSEAVYRFLNVTGDSSFARSVFPALRRSVGGTIRYHCDSLGFLTHGEYETRMRIPRGNRAADLQMRWKSQLDAAIAVASIVGDEADPNEVAGWKRHSTEISANFTAHFVDTSAYRIADHLTADGRRDMSVRPGIFAAAGLIADPALVRKIELLATSSLVYPSGVGTLASDDSAFVPFRYLAGYPSVKSGAWNGPVSPSLNAEWAIPMIGIGFADTVYHMLRSTEDLVLNGPCPGGFPECIDVLKKANAASPECSGSVASLSAAASYLRTWYDGFLGASVNGWGSHVTLTPNLPSAVHSADFNLAVGSSVMRVRYAQLKDEFRIELESPADARAVDWTIVAPSRLHPGAGNVRESSVHLLPGSKISIHIGANGFSIGDSSHLIPLAINKRSDGIPDEERNLFRFASVPNTFDPAQLKKPTVPYIATNELKQIPVHPVTLCDLSSKANDESGFYPDLAGLNAGSLDITHLTVQADAGNVYFTVTFRDLSYPRNHPEYGFDHTMLALAIEKLKKGSKGETPIGRNARYSVKNFSADNIVYVGKGLSVEDAKGHPLAVYEPLPGDEESPIGSFASRTISFSLPIALVGLPDNAWRFAVVAGVNDGSEGTGMFLQKEPTGRKNSTGNIYDVLRTGAAR